MENIQENTAMEEEAAPAAEAQTAEAPAGGGKRKKQKQKKPPCKAYRAVDRFFGFSERGTNLQTEIFAGILMCVEVACFMMVTAFLLTDASEEFARFSYLYYPMAMISVIATVLMGVICNAPLTQSLSMGMVVLMVSLFGNYAGLTYANVMAIALVANFVYMVVMLVPQARRFVLNAVPEAIRKVLPAALGAFIIVYVLIQTGMFSVNTTNFAGDLTGNAGDPLSSFSISYIVFNLDLTDPLNFYTYMPILTTIIGFLLMMILKNYKVKHSAIIGFGGSLLVFVLMWVIRGNFTDYNFYAFFTPAYGGYIHYNTAGLDVMFQNNILGEVFRTGFDFSELSASIGTAGVVGVFLAAMVSFLVIGVSETGAAVTGHGYVTGGLGEDGRAKYLSHTFMSEKKIVGTIESYANVYAVNAVSSVIGCAIGAGPVAVRAESTVGGAEGGKTGLSAIIAGLLLIITMYNTVFNGIFMNGIVVYGILLYVGFMLLTSLKNVDFTDVNTALPALLMVIISAVTANLTAGIAVGIILYTLFKMLHLKFKEVGVGTYVLTVIMILTLVSLWYVL